MPSSASFLPGVGKEKSYFRVSRSTAPTDSCVSTFLTDISAKFQALRRYHERDGVRSYNRTEYGTPWAGAWRGPHPEATYCGPNLLDPDWHYQKCSVIFLSDKSEYNEINILTDYFQVCLYISPRRHQFVKSCKALYLRDGFLKLFLSLALQLVFTLS